MEDAHGNAQDVMILHHYYAFTTIRMEIEHDALALLKSNSFLSRPAT